MTDRTSEWLIDQSTGPKYIFCEISFTFSTTKLIGIIEDESGINLSNFGVGQSIEMILDDQEHISLSEFYTSEIDDFTKGKIEYTLYNLEKGEHKIEVTAWDTFNNPSTSIVNFTVIDDENLLIREFKSYPNPFNSNTSLYLKV